MKGHIGIVQMRSTDQLDQNLDFSHQQIQQAADKGVDLLAFPETFLYIGSDNQEKLRVAQTLDGVIPVNIIGYSC
ncbi:MAG: nitrilase-related carbon-nitrogen hydrolase [Gammaproteobacteria bacterium]|nr:nitrilase-related carbon-nitrogen hydrolase [Gammaproteobacteria bacterium]